ncbi:MAG: alanine--glyoxylate aminotransferase family protein [Candidatus Omnitrophica bacterium]|nr:alanine--glyoxylate aminotransferase family protein [Candidatus Omnitrophota bacterium]MBI3021139.1 alanine--glyoxylate aminotransferase family protein [Candidatus Omnitrophota bacterium]
MTQDILLTPGPTPLPPEVREALARPIIHHRTGQYRALFKRTLQGMQTVMQTSKPVICFTSSGTGAMEAAVVNLLSPGDEAIVILGGKFAERWERLCTVYGITTVTIPVAYGEAVKPQAVSDALGAHPNAKAVFATLCETSTGVVNEIPAIAAMTRKSRAVLVVDAISGLLADECQTDAWGIDVVVTGSQKGLMLPPGLAFMSLNDRAWALVDQGKSPRFYTDLRLYRKALADDDTPFTSAVSTVVALEAALQLILQRGVPQTIQRCALMAEAARAGVRALGLKLFASRPSNGVTAVAVPDGIDGKQLTKLMYDRSRVMVAGGQGEMAGKIFRIAHMGYIAPDDVVAGLDALEQALAELGCRVAAGAGVKAGRAVLGQSASLAAR